MTLPPRRAARAAPRAVAAVVVLASMLFAAPGASAAAANATADREARELFQRAEINFNLGKFSAALADYQAAYETKPLPALLFNVAQCYRNLADYGHARFFYRRYLALDPRTSNRRLVEGLIGEMTRHLEKDDAKPAAPLGAAAAVPREDPAAARLNLASDPTTSEAASTSTALAVVAQATPAEQPPHPLYKRWWFWAGIGAVVVGGAVVGILATRSDLHSGSLATIDGR